MKALLYLPFLIVVMIQCRKEEGSYLTTFPGKPESPSSIKREHEYLLEQIHTITMFQDSTGIVAIKLNELMKHHFSEEEDFVLPPLALLPLLASGAMPEQSKEIVLLTDKLKSQLTHMSAEHQLIKAYLGELSQVAAKEDHPEVITLEGGVHKHAALEEEVLFPAAILIGEYLKLKSFQ
jgi:Hemerythrin HHE cation binding domain